MIAPVLADRRVQALAAFLTAEAESGKTLFPPQPQWFRALEMVAPDEISVVILGQDPYHGAGQAHGLSFSVPDGERQPPSLRNIFKELGRDTGIGVIRSGNLERWARQGVLLLNSALTVEEAKAGSHQGRGWELLTDAIISHAGRDEAASTVFMLWGNHAQKKRPLITASKHLILEAPHPSPLSAHRGFFGCSHFSKANRWLSQNRRQPINW